MIVSLDLETTGLDERVHQAWEVAYVREDGLERCWQFPVLAHKRCDPESLEIGGFKDRFVAGLGRAAEMRPASRPGMFDPSYIAARVAEELTDATLMGMAVQFDIRFLAALLRDFGWHGTDRQPHPWHHRALDLSSYAAGVLGAKQPLASRSLADRWPNDEAHTALGDARWNWTVYNALQELRRCL